MDNIDERYKKGKIYIITIEDGCEIRKDSLLRPQKAIKHHQLMEQEINKILLFLKCF